MPSEVLYGLILLSPLVGFLINGGLGVFNIAEWREESKKGFVGSIANISVWIPFIAFVIIFLNMTELSSDKWIVYQWFSLGNYNLSVGYTFDQLSVLMGLVVSGIGGLIHIYSIGYMQKDDGFWRFFAYLNLFVFAMLNLILAENLVVMFLGWEGVGLCSYLLIGFWYKKDEANQAAIKAFVMNRIGDFAVLIALFIIFPLVGSFAFSEINNAATTLAPGMIFTIGLLLFIGATGKSAQIPLYTWLPDAMAGPTPVSALIHAATMVTAGVYLVARLSPLFSVSQELMGIIAGIGGATAIFAATIGLFQNDIKKVLAYSTVSQLGYMFLAAGVGAFQIAIFHVFTHAFFKAALFLGSGSVIHGVHGEQDIRKMGGLKKYLPITYGAFFISTLALAGFPLTAGFFSKDEILFRVFDSGNYLLWIVALIGAALTAIYMMRLVSLTFYGDYRGNQKHQPHEAPLSMTIPVWILAIGSLLVGFLGLPGVITESNWISGWLHQTVVSFPTVTDHSTEWILIGLGTAVSLVGLLLGWQFYTTSIGVTEKLKQSFGGMYRVIANMYFIDQVYDFLITKPYQYFSEKILSFIEFTGFQFVIKVVAQCISEFSGVLRYSQTGYTATYISLFFIAVIAIIGYLLS